MSDDFDPYFKWLGIRPKDQPPHHYRLLGIETFETDVEVIEQAADRQMAFLHTFKTGRHSALSQKLLNEIAAARICLLDADKRQAYDEALRARLAPAPQPAQQPARPPAPLPVRVVSIPHAEPPQAVQTPPTASWQAALPTVALKPRATRRRGPPTPVLLLIAASGLFLSAVAFAVLSGTGSETTEAPPPAAAPERSMQTETADLTPRQSNPAMDSRPAPGLGATNSPTADARQSSSSGPAASKNPIDTPSATTDQRLEAPAARTARDDPSMAAADRTVGAEPETTADAGQPSAKPVAPQPEIPNSTAPKPADDPLEAIRKLGGVIERDQQQPNKPVLLVRVDNDGLTDEHLAALDGLNNLKSLELHGRHITEDGLAHLRALAALEELTLDRLAIADPAMENLASLTRLVRLRVTNCAVSDSGMKYLRGLVNLELLDLNHTHITGTGLGQLSGLKNLRTLVLDRARLNDKGLGAVARLSGLTRLSIADNVVSDAGLMKLKKLRKLEHLEVTRTQITREGVERFRKGISTEVVMRTIGPASVAGARPPRPVPGAAPPPPMSGPMANAVAVIEQAGGKFDFNSAAPNVRQRLHFMGPQVTNETLTQLKELPDLRTLTFWICPNVGDEGLKSISRLQNLDELGLFKTQVTDAGLPEVRGLTKLRTVSLGGTSVSTLEPLQEMLQMRSLNLWQAPITDDGFQYVARMRQLEILDIRFTRITSAGLAHIADLTNLTTLLALGNSGIDDTGLAHLRRLTRIKTLSIGNAAITDAGLAHLQDLAQLSDLLLDNAQITDAGLSQLRRHTELTSLNLDGTRITDAGLPELAVLKKLRSLSVRRTAVTDAGLARLKNDLPDLKTQR